MKLCSHKRVSTNRNPKGTVTWCKDCGKILAPQPQKVN